MKKKDFKKFAQANFVGEPPAPPGPVVPPATFTSVTNNGGLDLVNGVPDGLYQAYQIGDVIEYACGEFTKVGTITNYNQSLPAGFPAAFQMDNAFTIGGTAGTITFISRPIIASTTFANVADNGGFASFNSVPDGDWQNYQVGDTIHVRSTDLNYDTDVVITSIGAVPPTFPAPFVSDEVFGIAGNAGTIYFVSRP